MFEVERKRRPARGGIFKVHAFHFFAVLFTVVAEVDASYQGQAWFFVVVADVVGMAIVGVVGVVVAFEDGLGRVSVSDVVRFTFVGVSAIDCVVGTSVGVVASVMGVVGVAVVVVVGVIGVAVVGVVGLVVVVVVGVVGRARNWIVGVALSMLVVTGVHVAGATLAALFRVAGVVGVAVAEVDGMSVIRVAGVNGMAVTRVAGVAVTRVAVAVLGAAIDEAVASWIEWQPFIVAVIIYRHFLWFLRRVGQRRYGAQLMVATEGC